MLDPRIAQRLIELEQRKKQQQKSLQQGQNNVQSKPAIKPTPAINETPKAAQRNNDKTSCDGSGVTVIPVVKQTENQGAVGYKSPAFNAGVKLESVYKPNSQIANNEYTTASQRQQQNQARQKYISRMHQKSANEYGEYTHHKTSGGYVNAAYTNIGTAKSSHSPSASQSNATSGVTTRTVQQNNDFNTLWNKYGAQLMGDNSKPKASGPNAEIGKAAVPKKENSTFEKIENQSVNYAKSGWKLFDWMDDFGNNKGPNNEISNTVKIKESEKADLTAGAQGDKPQKPVEMYVSKDIVKEPYDLTEHQKLQKEILELYGEKGRKGVQERHSLSPDADVFDTSKERQRTIELENQLDMLDRANKAGLYDEDMSMLDRFGNTAKEWANRGLYSVDYIAQTAGTALTDYFESQLNEEYNYLINRRQDIVVQLNRITFGMEEDPYGKREKTLTEQLENINRKIEENYRIKMDIITDAYRAMERAQRYEDKAVEGLSSAKRLVYSATTEIPKLLMLKGAGKINNIIPFAESLVNDSAEKMHEISSSGGTAEQALVNGAVNAGISAVSEKMKAKELSSFLQGDIGKIVLKEEFAKHGVNLSKCVLEYTAKHLADIASQNPYADFSIDEMVEEFIKDYTETAINSF